MARWQALVAGTGLILAAGLVGCGSGQTVKPPPTQKVEGVVVRADGKPAGRGAIEFRHIANPEFVTQGEVKDDGTFTLITQGGNSPGVAGAQEGEHEVTFTPNSDKQEEMTPITLSKTYTVKAGENKITVKLEK